MDYERWLLEDALDFEFDGRGYRFEPEFTQEELREMEARATEAPEAPAEAVPRITGNWWCACGKCRQMPTEIEIPSSEPSALHCAASAKRSAICRSADWRQL
ncbi:unnamed protein product [Boreogadus saida]